MIRRPAMLDLLNIFTIMTQLRFVTVNSRLLTRDIVIENVVFLHGIIEKLFRFFVHDEDFPLHEG
jgi:hypothetical protein